MISLKVDLDVSEIDYISENAHLVDCKYKIFAWSASLSGLGPVYLYPERKYSYSNDIRIIYNFEEEVYQWLIEISMEVSLCVVDSTFIITFNNNNDALLFKMTWL